MPFQSTSDPRRSRGVLNAFALPLVMGAAQWLIDALRLAAPHHPSSRQLALGLGSALATVLAAALVIALLLSSLVRLGLSAPAGLRGGFRLVRKRLSAWLDT